MYRNLSIADVDPQTAEAMEAERMRQETHIELIASENFASPAVMAAQGSVLTNKYAEGYPGRRYYGGCRFVDEVERLAIERAKLLFGAAFANVQPHSGSQANQAVYFSVLKPGDVILGMSIGDGGHLTHGAGVNLSGKIFKSIGYGLCADDGLLDYDQALELAKEHKPKMVVCGASAYARKIDFARFRAIADEVGAYLLADIAHYAGLVAAGIYPNPVTHAHFVTTTTHKTLRGPRGGMILTNDEKLAKKVNASIFPGAQGGPLLHAVAGKAVAFAEAQTPEFRDYQKRVVANAQALAQTLMDGGVSIVSGGTDCHMMLADLRPLGVTGKAAEERLDDAHITLNKNGVPNDTHPPTIAGGIRLGTPAATTRGFGENEFKKTGELILRVLKNIEDEDAVTEARAEVEEMCARFPIYERAKG